MMMEFIRDGLLALFEIFINLSLVGSFCVLLVLAARFLLRRAPKWCSYILWSVVFLRLICPVFPEGSFSLIPRQLSGQLQIDGEAIMEQVQESKQTNIEGSILATEDTVVKSEVLGAGNELLEQGMRQAGVTGNVISNGTVISGSEMPYANEELAYSGIMNVKPSTDSVRTSSGFLSIEEVMKSNQTVKPMFDMDAMTRLMIVLAVIWIIGAVGFAVYHIASYQLLKRRVKNAVPREEGVLELQGEHLSFVMGIVNPKIYLSEGLDAETRRVILCHESVHLKRRDYIFKPTVLGICCLHWWNPLVWLAFYLMNKDCEMSCDEKVVALLGEESKAVYSYALLSEATCGESFHGRRGSVCALLSFGEDHVKNRISHVLKYKKASIGVICCAVLVLAVLAVGLCSNPKTEETSEELTEIASEEKEELLKQQEKAKKAEQEELLKQMQEELEAQEAVLKAEQEVLNTELTADKNVAEQEAIQAQLEQLEKEQQEIERLKQEQVQDEIESLEAQMAENEDVILALEKYAWAFMDRDGDALQQLAYDKVAFELWDMVYRLEDGSYGFGDSSPWVRDWYTIYTPGDDKATIRFIMENSAPEYYMAEEQVKITEADGNYYVDHVDYTLYSEVNSVQEMEKAYEWKNGTAIKSIRYNVDYARAILEHLVNGTNPEYYSAYQNPVSAAKLLFHLADANESILNYEILKMVSPKNRFNNDYGEGTVAMVVYEFEDGLALIPMVLVEESKGIWMPAESDEVIQEVMQGKWDNMSTLRKVYHSCEVGAITYQLTNYGIYQLDSKGLKLLYPTKVGVGAKLAYDNGMLYFPTDKSYYEGALDWADNSICVLNTKTLEVGYIDLPQGATNYFPLDAFGVNNGYIHLWKDENSDRCYDIPVTDVFPVYKGKLAAELNAEEKDAYGSEIREQILANPNQVFRIGHHASTTTFAYVDMDGDVKAEEITMTKNGEDGYLPMDSFVLTAGEGREERYMESGSNEIYAYSPDGERIFVVLYEDGPSGDPLSTFFKYENNRLQEAGTIASDVRTADLEDGVISTVIRRDVIQTDRVKVQYRLNEENDVELIGQETYDFTGLNDVELKETLKLYTEPNGTKDTIIMMKPQTVHITKTDKDFGWVLLEAEDGTEGWLRVKDILYVGDDEVPAGQILDGLLFAG